MIRLDVHPSTFCNFTEFFGIYSTKNEKNIHIYTVRSLITCFRPAPHISNTYFRFICLNEFFFREIVTLKLNFCSCVMYVWYFILYNVPAKAKEPMSGLKICTLYVDLTLHCLDFAKVKVYTVRVDVIYYRMLCFCTYMYPMYVLNIQKFLRQNSQYITEERPRFQNLILLYMSLS